MKDRTRKLIGTVALLLFLAVYTVLALAVAVVLQVSTTDKWVELAFYIIAGLIWVVPAAGIVSWMSRSSSDPDHKRG
jgi:cation transporter-like permease